MRVRPHAVHCLNTFPESCTQLGPTTSSRLPYFCFKVVVTVQAMPFHKQQIASLFSRGGWVHKELWGGAHGTSWPIVLTYIHDMIIHNDKTAASDIYTFRTSHFYQVVTLSRIRHVPLGLEAICKDWRPKVDGSHFDNCGKLTQPLY